VEGLTRGEGSSSVKKDMVIDPIGYIRSEHTEASKTPIQPVYARGCRGKAEILPEYEEGLRDLEEFSHVIIIYYFHRAKEPRLTVKPFLEDVPHGVFATRSPRRPNPIGFSLVRLVRREGHILFLDDVDMLDGTPILDIKPFVPRFDFREDARSGWQESVDDETAFGRGRREFDEG
jgi:tRNA-Thr(GGU) m(6)t(6)A37 methyltransferase TsaA